METFDQYEGCFTQISGIGHTKQVSDDDNTKNGDGEDEEVKGDRGEDDDDDKADENTQELCLKESGEVF